MLDGCVEDANAPPSFLRFAGSFQRSAREVSTKNPRGLGHRADSCLAAGQHSKKQQI